MAPVLLYKYLNVTANTTTDTGHTININCNTKYSIMVLMMILFVTSTVVY